MVDVSVRDDNLLERKLMPAQHGENVFDLVARIDHQRFVRRFVANDGAIASEHSDRKDLVNHAADLLKS
jgi:hypothetical protein